MGTTSAVPEWLPMPGLLVVRTRAGWSATPPSGRDPIPMPLDVVILLARASAGSPIDPDDGRLDDQLLSSLVAAGALVAAPSSAGDEPMAWSAETGASAVAPLTPTTWVWPIAATVGRMAAGCIVVEGRAGVHLPLDDIDLVLLDAVDMQSGAAVSTVATEARRRLAAAGGAGSDLDLRTRLARLTAVGALRSDAGSVTADGTDLGLGDDAPGPIDADPIDADPGAAGAAPASVSPAPERSERPSPERNPGGGFRDRVISHARRLRTQPFPGRATLKAAYRRRRPDLTNDPDQAAPSSDNPPPVDPGEAPPVPSIDPKPTPTAASASSPELYVDDPRVGLAIDGRIPVYAPFQVEVGPALALGMLTASARRADDGRLNRAYEIRRVEDPDAMLADLACRPGPAIVLCSNYLWSLEHNLGVVRRAVAINPELIVIHGGPDTPAYPQDCQQFFADHPDLVHVTVRGEGEAALVDILGALAEALPSVDLSRLADVPGISYRDPATGRPVTTDDRERTADLDQLPSPYLTGEFDHLTTAAFASSAIFETNRGCPYGCTFCDWGSSTLSRIRKFDLERVRAEMRWAGEHGIVAWVLADANLGIMSRDVEVIDAMAAVQREFGVPTNLGFNVAKNTTKHLTAIMDRLVEAGISAHVSLALQTNDASTLEAIRRTNIDVDHYVALAASFRRHGLPLQADLMLGLPGQTIDSFCRDLQFTMEHDIAARVWITQLLRNSPMNDPEYRDEFAIVADEGGLVVSTSTYSVADRLEMKRIRHAHAVFERFGLLRHVMRHLQWDHGIPMVDVLRRAADVSRDDPDRYPLLNWSMRYFDHYGTAPLGWRSFLTEIRRFLADEFAVLPSPALETVLALQEFLLPAPGRSFPDTIVLDHDYPAYHRAATAMLWTTGRATDPTPKLRDFGPARFTIYGDPLDRCTWGMKVFADPRNDRVTDEFWMSGHFELDSPLVVNYADVAGTRRFIGLVEQVEHAAANLVVDDDPAEDEAAPAADGKGVAVAVAVGPTRSTRPPSHG